MRVVLTPRHCYRNIYRTHDGVYQKRQNQVYIQDVDTIFLFLSGGGGGGGDGIHSIPGSEQPRGFTITRTKIRTLTQGATKTPITIGATSAFDVRHGGFAGPLRGSTRGFERRLGLTSFVLVLFEERKRHGRGLLLPILT